MVLKKGDEHRKMKTAQIKKWGNSKGVLLPKVILDMLSLKTDDAVDIDVIDQEIVITPIKKKPKSLLERFEGYGGVTKQEEFLSDETVGKEIF